MLATGSALRARLSALGALEDDGLDLGSVALTIAHLDHLHADTSEYDDHLTRMSQSLTGHDGCSAKDLAHMLAATLTDVYGYQAPDMDEDESDLMDTIDTRRGCSETLGVLALEIMARAGWDAQALSFGPRFLVRITDEDGSRALLDPAGGWTLVEAYHMRSWLKAQAGMAAEMDFTHLQPLSNRGVLLRLQNGAKVRFLRSGHLEQALQTIEITLLFAPDTDALWREAGILHARLNHYADAVAALERFLSQCRDPSLRARTLQILTDLRQRLTYQ